MRKRKGNNKMSEKPSEWDIKNRVQHNWTVHLGNGKTQTVVANRFANQTAGGVVFFGSPDSGYENVAFFRDVVSVTPVPDRVYPEPVKGVEYYTLADLEQALKDLNYVSVDHIINGVRKRVSVRDDGRYTIDELKRAARETDYTSGSYRAELLDKAALQARKNRVFDAHGGS